MTTRVRGRWRGRSRSSRGTARWAITGAPVRLAEVTQRQAQDTRARATSRRGRARRTFILGNVRDHARALRFTAALRRRGIAFEAQDAVVLDV